jgi:ferritin-like metal-binding protein YciE
MQGQAELLHVVLALRATGRLTGLLDRRQQQGNQDRDDGDDHEQFDESETSPLGLNHDTTPAEKEYEEIATQTRKVIHSRVCEMSRNALASGAYGIDGLGSGTVSCRNTVEFAHFAKNMDSRRSRYRRCNSHRYRFSVNGLLFSTERCQWGCWVGEARPSLNQRSLTLQSRAISMAAGMPDSGESGYGHIVCLTLRRADGRIIKRQYFRSRAMKLMTLQDLLIEQLKDLYSAENQLVKALPKMAEAASSAELKEAFESHLVETETHVSRLEQIFQRLNAKPGRKKCKAMAGLVEEGKETIDENAEPMVHDAALIAAAQRVEHYEIAAYGTARTFATILGDDETAELLQTTLDEEGECDKKLTEIAMSGINQEAVEPAEVGTGE